MSEVNYWQRLGNRRTARRTLLVGGAAFAAAASGMGCGSSNDKDAATTSSASPAAGGGTQQAAQPQGQPKMGGTLVAAMPKEPTNYDPHLQVDSSKVGFLNLTSNGLFRIKSKGVTDFQSLDMEPELLASMPETPDKTTMILKVRQGVKWHNLPPVNGRVFNAEDVKYNIERMKLAKQADGGNNERAWIQAEIDSVTVVDPATVSVKFKKPSPLWVNFMATGYQKLIAPEVKEPTTTLIGTGPFTMQKHDRDAQAVFKKNPDYFKQGMPYIDEFIWRSDTAPGRRVAGLKTGDYAFGGVEPTDFPDVKKANPKIIEHKYLPLTYPGVTGFDLTVKPLDDVRIRRAVAQAIDYEGIIKAVFDGDGNRQPMIPLGFSEFAVKPSDLPNNTYNVEKARALMREAGYDATKMLKLEIETNQAYPNNVKMQPILKEQLKEIFIDVTALPALPPTEFLGKRNSAGGGWMIRMWEHATFSEPDEFLYSFYHTTGSRNYGKWGGPELDAMIEKQRGDVSKEERKKILGDIQRELADKMYRIGTVVPTLRYVIQPWLKGFSTLAAESGYQGLQVENSWIDKS